MEYIHHYASPFGGLRLPATGSLLRGYGLTVRSILDLPFLMNMNRENFLFLSRLTGGLRSILAGESQIFCRR